MGKELRKYHQMVELALKIIDDEKNISWLEAIAKARVGLEDKVSGKEEDDYYNSGEVIG